jgi:peroxiredoxin
LLHPLARHGPAQTKRGSDLGRPIADFTLSDQQGRSISLSDMTSNQAVVLVFTGVNCPVGNLYMPRIVALAEDYKARGVSFLSINANAHDTVGEMAAHALRHGVTFPTLKDRDNRLADRLRVDRVGEVLVLDAERRLCYRGAVDDQYARGAFKDQPTRSFLVEALEAVLSGQPVATPMTSVVTCPIERVHPRGNAPNVTRASTETARHRRRPSPEYPDVGPVTYVADVAPLLRNRCQSCHQSGEAGPFSLVSYEDARRHARSIREVIDQGLMPPWGADARFGTFANDRSLTERERAVFLAWVDQGMPAGNLESVPPGRETRLGWTIGLPDLVFEMSEAFDVPTSGQLPIQKFLVPTNLAEDVWVQAAQAMPGDRAVVHHICIFIIDPAIVSGREGDKESRRRERPELVCYAPGDMPCIYPDGIAKKLPAGSILEIQVHYQPIGVPRFDRSSVGIRLARQPVRQMAVTRSASNRDFLLAPGAANAEVRAEYTLLEDCQLLNLTPHMHYRGRDFRFDAIFPDGRRQTLLFVPHYDFNWQDVYRLAEPLPLPRGTRISCIAHFDNSAANPVNPDPTREARWGEQTTDEMMIGYFDYCVDLEQSEPAPADSWPDPWR